MTYNIRPDRALCFPYLLTLPTHTYRPALSHQDKHTQLAHCILVIHHDLITVSLLRDGSISNYGHWPVCFVSRSKLTTMFFKFHPSHSFKICRSSHQRGVGV